MPSCLDTVTGLGIYEAMASRRDRSATALRPLALSQGLLSRADGSAQFSFGAHSPALLLTTHTHTHTDADQGAPYTR